MAPKRMRHLVAPQRRLAGAVGLHRARAPNSPGLPTRKRQLEAPATRLAKGRDCASSKKMARTAKATLDPSPSLRDALTSKVARAGLPITEEDLARLPVTSDKSFGLTAAAGSGSSSSSACSSRGKTRTRQLQKKSKNRLKKYLHEAMECAGEQLTFLERRAVSRKVEKYYKFELQGLQDHCRRSGKTLDSIQDEDLDIETVDYFNSLFWKGHQAHRGEKVIASVMHHYPKYGKIGKSSLPKTWRALKGWRKLTPGRSRLAHALGVWAAVSCQMRARGNLRMSLFNMLSLSSYARPSELLRIRLFSLVRPVATVNTSWCLLLSPEEGQRPSKTGDYDVSVALNSPYTDGWMPQVLTALKASGRPEDAAFDFDYSSYLKEFRIVTGLLGLELTPYQARHSGPSIDRSRDLRTQAEVQKRGQWRAVKSVMRYEKSARLSATFAQLPEKLQRYAALCEEHLEEAMLNPNRVPPLPSIAEA